MNRLVRNRSLCGETRRQSRQQRRGFTLTELLVTMAIMALLLGVLLSHLSKAWGAPKGLQDEKNLQTVYIALVGYAEDHEGSFPKVTNLAEADQQVRKALEPYLKDKEFFSKLPPLGWRYAIDPKERSLNSVKLDQIRDPGHTPIAGEQFSPERGQGKLLVLFADGHVERLTQKELGELLKHRIDDGKIAVDVRINGDEVHISR